MNWAGMAGAAAGAARGYESTKLGTPPPAQGQQPGQGPLMKYLRRNQHKPYGQNKPFDQGSMGQPAGSPPMPGDAPMPGAMPPTANPMPGLATTQPVQPSMGPQNPYPPPGSADPQIPAFAQGSVVTKPTTAILGEDGPEMVVPLSGREDAKVSPSNLMKMQYSRRC